ncbi:LysR family transcriptional regulator [Aliidongia dinghuensis]|uniref:LysR family transcriptional regulator n=1 Tax=Aliidongia dinghuensis TaxID=1867774 RepID=A0A8J2Z2D1_9PROT|nr:LysR substrate-binding domain-containing protein [Aliidongia dinghuensis]GGF51554.1 LysR family transcriptional regulator [Aliidongia dinghuensis]
MRDLPPLNALVAFEIVARSGSVRRAAEELAVTPGAVSRQLRLLEDHFGVALFVRQGRGLTLTPIGTTYFERVTSHFDGLRRASALLHSSSGRAVLRVRSYTTFATRWLIPRLSQFQLAHPEIDVRLTTASEWSDLGDFDAAIRLGDGAWPEFDVSPLVANVLQPVCSPSLFQRMGIANASRLSKQNIFLVRARPDDWSLWCESAGVEFASLTRRKELESSALAYLAAIEGRGVALAQTVLVEDELRTGSLVPAHDHAFDRGRVTYYLVSDQRSRKREPLSRLRRWLAADGPEIE